MKTRNAHATNGLRVGSGYDCEARQYEDGTVLLNLMTPTGDYDVLYEMGIKKEDFDLEGVVYDVASRGPGWFEAGDEVEKGEVGWSELAEKWNSWKPTH